MFMNSGNESLLGDRGSVARVVIADVLTKVPQ